jgi:hypothetical protein
MWRVWGKGEVCTGFGWGGPRERDHWGDRDIVVVSLRSPAISMHFSFVKNSICRERVKKDGNPNFWSEKFLHFLGRALLRIGSLLYCRNQFSTSILCKCSLHWFDWSVYLRVSSNSWYVSTVSTEWATVPVQVKRTFSSRLSLCLQHHSAPLHCSRAVQTHHHDRLPGWGPQYSPLGSHGMH